MATIYYDDNADLTSLRELILGVVGYGNQGRAHALNLRDSGLNVVIGTRSGSTAKDVAKQDGFEALDIGEVAEKADIIALLLPDEHAPSVYEQHIRPNLKGPKSFVFAHGFVIHHRTLVLPSDCDILLVAPTGPGRQLRSLYQEGAGLPALVAVEQDASGQAWPRCLAYARAVGCTRAGAIKTTFSEETITDLFCEQAVLCGGMPELIKASFDTLVAKGYQSELAYISCLKEVKLIADLLFTRGVDGMREAISNTAKYGSAVAGPAIINSTTKHALNEILENIETGSFAKEFLNDTANGAVTVKDFMRSERHSRLARTGRELREKLNF